MDSQLEETGRVRARCLGASLAAHGLAAAALFVWPPAPRPTIRPAEATAVIVAERTLPPAPRPRTKARTVQQRVERAKPPALVATPMPAPPEPLQPPDIRFEHHDLPAIDPPRTQAPVEPVSAVPALAPAALRAPEPPPAVRSTAFDAPRVGAAGRTVAARPQAGGFGAAEGERESAGRVEVRGAGFGRAVAGERRASGPVSAALAGFASSAAATPGGGSRPAQVADGGFEAAAAARASAPAPPVAPAHAAFEPVEVLAKPKPEYTAEARARRIEGEVLVETLFRADGRAEPLRVLRGLGHGLDESARDAVERIRFRPARRDGRPVDATLAVAVAFRLAY